MATKEFVFINGFKHDLYKPEVFTEEEILSQSRSFYERMDKRRSVREFADTPVPREIIESLIKTASTAPSGANKQPWTFCAISNPALKNRIRIAAEKEEIESYKNRMSDRWLNDLEPLATNVNKPFLEIAPWLIVVFKQAFEYGVNGEKLSNYYVNESVGLACGMLISAIHNAGLVTLTHTPSPMHFLTEILNRPDNEKAFLLLPVGYASNPVYVPCIERKKLEDTSIFYE